MAELQRLFRSAPVDISADEVAANRSIADALHKLSRLLVSPLLPATGVSARWYISPDDQLWLVPWSALIDDNNRYLVGVKKISYLVSGRELLYMNKDPQGLTRGPAVAMYNPQFDSNAATDDRKNDAVGLRSSLAEQLPMSWNRLPYTALEGANIQDQLGQLFQANVVTRNQAEATEAFFKQSVVRPTALFFATHGFVLNESEAAVPGDANKAAIGRAPRLNALERCGLVLAGANHARELTTTTNADGLLTGKEIAEVDLRGTELVVLSACDTALGELRSGDGVAGLRQAFQIAGARSVLATLWPVDDRAAAQLTPEIFDRLLAGRSIVDAVHEAQVAIFRAHVKAGRTGHPFYWAAFTITGAADRVLVRP